MKKDSQIIFWVIISTLYFASRLINIQHFPIFTDEAIYSYWSQVALNDPQNRFISLEDGKQPLFIWLAAIFQSFIPDPLIATRLVSTFAGFGTLIGIYLLTKTLLNKNTAILACILYLILPFTLLYDRLALYDSLLTMFVVYSVFFTVKLVQNHNIKYSLLAGISIGLGMITKSSANFFLYLMPVSLLISQKKIIRWAAFALMSFITAQTIYNSLRLSPLFYMVSRKNLEFIRSPQEVVKDPFQYFNSNANAMASWLVTYISLPLFLLFLFGLVLGYFKKERSIIYLSMLIFVPFVAEVFFNKVLYPRFMLFYFPFVIILISYAAVWVKKSYQKFSIQLTSLFILLLLFPLSSSYKILTNPQDAKIADSDSGQYLNNWPSGFGVYEIRDFIKSQPQDEQIYIATEGTFGLLPFALQIYFYGRENIHVIGFWPVDQNKLPQQVLDLAKTNKTYFIFNENQKEINNPNLRQIAKYQKGRGDSYMRLFEVTPK